MRAVQRIESRDSMFTPLTRKPGGKEGNVATLSLIQMYLLDDAFPDKNICTSTLTSAICNRLSISMKKLRIL